MVGTSMSAWAKPVAFTRRLGPNFLWHMLAVAKVGYDSEYADRYRPTLAPEALRTIQANAESLRFGGGSSGAMSGFFAFLPGWLHLESKGDFERYFASVERSLREGSFAPLVDAFAGANWADKAFAHLPSFEFPADSDVAAVFSSIAGAYMNAYDSYVGIVWPDASSAMASRSRELNDWFARTDYVAAWERELEIAFDATSYEIVLCYANKNGPDYNSLGYTGNLFYFDKPFDRTWQFASHEIGTHLLFDVLADAARALDVEPPLLHREFEVLAMFYNRRVLRAPRLAYDIPSCNDVPLLEYYDREYRVGIEPKNLLMDAWLHRSERA
jgi:hypothetical protein